MGQVVGRGTPRRLWRHVVGAVLRDARRRRGEILAEVAARAGVSPQYLSEVERGVKEPSSEVLAAVADALGLTLSDVTRQVTIVLEAGARRRRLQVVQQGQTEAAVHPRAVETPGSAVLLAA